MKLRIENYEKINNNINFEDDTLCEENCHNHEEISLIKDLKLEILDLKIDKEKLINELSLKVDKNEIIKLTDITKKIIDKKILPSIFEKLLIIVNKISKSI